MTDLTGVQAGAAGTRAQLEANERRAEQQAKQATREDRVQPSAGSDPDGVARVTDTKVARVGDRLTGTRLDVVR